MAEQNSIQDALASALAQFVAFGFIVDNNRCIVAQVGQPDLLAGLGIRVSEPTGGQHLSSVLDSDLSRVSLDAITTALDKKYPTSRTADSRSVPLRVDARLLQTGANTDPHILISFALSEPDAANADASLIQFRQMAEQSSDMLSLVDRNGQIKYANPAVCKVTGYSLDELKTMHTRQISPSFDTAGMQTLFDTARESWPPPIASEIVCKDGRILPVSASISLIEFGGESYLHANVRDISKLKRAERDLQLFKSAIEATTEGVLIADASTVDMPIIFANRGFERLSGYSIEEAVGRNCRFLQGPGTDPQSVAVLRSELARGRAVRCTLVNYRKDGTPFWNDLAISPVHDESGAVTHFVGMQSDATQTLKAGSPAAAVNARLQTIMNTTTDGILGLDADGHCTFCNTPALRMLGYDQESDLVGLTLVDLMPPDSFQGTGQLGQHPDHTVTMGEMTADTGARMLRKDGSVQFVDYKSQPLIYDYDLIGSLITFSDSATRIARERRFEQAQIAADAANRAKSEFLANMSHEIRTPLSAIMSFAELLLSSPDIGNGRDSASAIKRNAHNLLDIVNDILDLSKIEADQLALDQQPLSVPSVMSDLQAMMRIRAREKGLAFDMEAATPFPEIIRADRVRLRQILVNLISNAIKFTDKGTVSVRVVHEPPMLAFEVIDTGIGMTDAQQQQLFKPFTQGDAIISQRFGGTGLGLSICKRLIDRMGGSIEVTSRIHQGSCFTARLPTGDVTDTKIISELAPPVDDGAGTSAPAPVPIDAHIMIADDRPDVLSALEQLLQLAGARVTTARDGEEAVQLAQQFRHLYDLVLLDLQMPRRDGFQTVSALRAMGYNKPVIALTAQAMKGERERALAVGFDEFLAKPIEADLLANTIRRALEPVSNKRKPVVLIVDDHADSANALAQLLRACACEVHTSLNGSEARHSVDNIVPEFCLMDIHLPDIDGAALLKELRARCELRDTRFIAVTGETGDDIERRLLAAGFDHYYAKPLDFEALRTLIFEHSQPKLSDAV